MKNILTTVLALACVTLLVAFFLTKQGATAQHDTDTASITEFSNTLTAAQSQITDWRGTMINLSNHLDECQSAALATSNTLAAAQTTIAADATQITDLTQQVARLGSENQALGRSAMEMTNALNSQLATLNEKVTLLATNLEDVQRDHVLLEDRLRRDVAERLVIQRQFYNPEALQAQMNKLKDAAGSLDVTADKIYAGLDIEVRSNGSIHVLSPE